MQVILMRIYKIWHLLSLLVAGICSKVYCLSIFYFNGIKYSSLNTKGFPQIHVSLKAKCYIGKNFSMNNGVKFSDSGVNGKCRIEVRDNAILTIGKNVGMSDVTISCHEKITLGDNILLGVGSQIRDTDNHSLNPQDRLNGLDWINKRTSPITINDNVFIGAYCFILKGVTIGVNSIVGAASVVTKDIPANEIWAGNPAKFIRKIN